MKNNAETAVPSLDDVVVTDKQAIADAFGKAAKHYDQSAAFQRQVGHHLMRNYRRSMSRVASIGSGLWDWVFQRAVAAKRNEGLRDGFVLPDA